MPSSTLTVFKKFLEYEAEKIVDLGADSLKIALTVASPVAATDDVLADLTEIAYTNLSTRVITTTSSAEASGTYKLVLQDLTLTASGGPVAAFRYLSIYDDTPTAPADPLIGFLDYGSSLTLADGESLLVDFSAANGVLQKTASP